MIIDSRIEESRLKHEKRVHILNTAYEMFCRNGIENVSMLDIAEQSGMKRRNIYNYYDNKEQIALELMECWYHALNDMSRTIEDDLSGAATAIDVMRRWLNSFFTFATTDKDAFIYSVHFDHYFRNHEDTELFRSYTVRVDPFFVPRKLLEQGIEDGSVRDDYEIDYDLLESAIQGAILSFTQRLLFYEKELSHDHGHTAQEIKVLIDFIIQALQK